MTPLARAVSAAAVSLALVALPPAAQAQRLSRPDIDFTALLPPTQEVPWLTPAGRPKRPAVLPDAGSLTALLFKPAPALSGPYCTAQDTSPNFVGM